MKLLVVSDSHGEKNMLAELKTMYDDKVDVMIHCGDSELSSDDPALEGFISVRGNCDIDSRLPEEQIINMDGTVIFVAHGHLHRIKWSLLPISYRAKEIGANFVFFGHSHLLGAELLDNILYLNPGSISLPRGGNEKTYAIVEKDGSTYDVYYFNEQHEELKTLRKRLES